MRLALTLGAALAVSTVSLVSSAIARPVAATGLSTAPNQAPPGLVPPATDPGPTSYPTASSSLKSWQVWAAAETMQIEAVPYAKDFAADGYTVQSISFVSVGQIPGMIPAGVTSTAAVVVAAPAQQVPVVAPAPRSASTSSPNAMANPDGYTGSCKIISYGTVCVGYEEVSGGHKWDAGYGYGTRTLAIRKTCKVRLTSAWGAVLGIMQSRRADS